LLSLISIFPAEGGSSARSQDTIDIAPVWAGQPVGFALLTHGDRQFVAFYDAERQMTVGVRKLDSREWHFVRLPSKLGWDSHNYVTLAVDRDNYIHLSGNMHCDPLIYFRTTRTLDIDTFERIPAMIGDRERRCTYPRFFRGPQDELIFTYRDGGSGNGDQLYNVYDADARKWRRLVDGPLISGQGEMNAYIQGPVRDRQGVYHMCWVWRDTPDCATNHDLCYARSRDLVHWETSAGRPLKLPMTIKGVEIVDPVPVKGGLLNGNMHLAFDSKGRVIISYHKYDAAGALQVYNARLEDKGWKIQQASDWTWRYEFSGVGSIGAQVRVYPIEVTRSGLRQRYQNARHGTGMWLLDEETLKPLPPSRVEDGISEKVSRVEEAHPGITPAVMTSQPVLMTRTAADLGDSPDLSLKYRLEWQTLPPNRDRPREGPLPPPSMLQLVISRTNER